MKGEGGARKWTRRGQEGAGATGDSYNYQTMGQAAIAPARIVTLFNFCIMPTPIPAPCPHLPPTFPPPSPPHLPLPTFPCPCSLGQGIQTDSWPLSRFSGAVKGAATWQRSARFGSALHCDNQVRGREGRGLVGEQGRGQERGAQGCWCCSLGTERAVCTTLRRPGAGRGWSRGGGLNKKLHARVDRGMKRSICQRPTL